MLQCYSQVLIFQFEGLKLNIYETDLSLKPSLKVVKQIFDVDSNAITTQTHSLI